MNRAQAIKWCKDYLPAWPVIYVVKNYVQGLSKPIGWDWKNIGGAVSLTRQGDNIFNGDVFPPVKIPPMPGAPVQPAPAPSIFKEDAIKWCKNFLPTWPTKLSSTNSPYGWVWERSRLPYDKLSTIYLVKEKMHQPTANNIITEQEVFPAKMFNRAQAIKWCKDYLPAWPDGDNKTLVMSKLAAPIGWYWNYMQFPNEQGWSIELLSLKNNSAIYQYNVFPSVVQPAAMPVPEHVKDFLKEIETMKFLNPPLARRMTLTTRKGFDKLVDDLPDFGIRTIKGAKSTVYDTVKVQVLNDDMFAVTAFISENSDLFETFLEKQNRKGEENFDNIINTLFERGK